MWRACTEALPTGKNLNWRKIMPDGLFKSCKARNEDCSHDIFFCSDVQVMWSLNTQWTWLSALQGSSVKEIFNYAFSKNTDAALLAFTGWAVGNHKNQIRFKENACPLNQILPLLKEWKAEFQSHHPATLKIQHRNHTRWKPLVWSLIGFIILWYFESILAEKEELNHIKVHRRIPSRNL